MAQKVVSSVDVSYIEVAVVSTGSADAGKVVGLNDNGKVDISVLPFTVPTGGTTGQILAKKTDSDYDLQWISLPSGVPTGAVEYFAMAAAPSGWLAADGSAVSRTTYVNLFVAISTTFGAGDGSTTFNLPDLRGEFVRGYDNSRGVDSGRVFGSSQVDMLKSHTHTYAYTHPVTSGGNVQAGNGVPPQDANTGATGGTETRPRNHNRAFVSADNRLRSRCARPRCGHGDQRRLYIQCGQGQAGRHRSWGPGEPRCLLLCEGGRYDDCGR